MAHIPWPAVCGRRLVAVGWAVCSGGACDPWADHREHPGVSPYAGAFGDWAGVGLCGAGVVFDLCVLAGFPGDLHSEDGGLVAARSMVFGGEQTTAKADAGILPLRLRTGSE